MAQALPRALALCGSLWRVATGSLVFSAGFSSDAVLQRGRNASVYGFASGAAAPRVSVAVAGADAAGAPVSYEVAAEVSRWNGDSYQPDTEPAPPHGAWVWKALLRVAAAGGEYTITASDGAANSSASIERVTFGDVWFCSGQSNMALMTFYTFSADALKEEVRQGRYANVRHFQVGRMNHHYAAFDPQWATTQNSLAAGQEFVWHNLTSSAALPSLDPRTGAQSPFAQFGATCLYFGVELTDAMSAQGLGGTPIGLIQSSIGGSQIEAWMSNETLKECSNEALSGGAVPQDSGALYYGMVAPFVNYSVRGWVWYQGENNVYGDMGSSSTGIGYGCQLPAMVDSWRAVWDAAPDALFGIVTLAAEASEGRGWHMAGMRWSQTANYGVWPNPALPYTFGAQAYDLGDPWANVGDGNRQEDGELQCCFVGPDCGSPGHRRCDDKLNCSLPDISTGRYGDSCSAWDRSLWSRTLKPLEGAVRANSPSGIPANNFMGPIHPRVKRPVGRRLAVAAARQLVGEVGKGAWTGPTISRCSLEGGRLELFFNSSLLGGEGLMLRPFNANLSSWLPSGRLPDWPQAARDSLGTMLCVANESAPERGNATTCMCQGWNYVIQQGMNRKTFWYCEDGPGYKPPALELAAEEARRKREAPNNSKPLPTIMNPWREQWQPAALLASSRSSVVVDTSGLGGLEPLAVRLAWPLFDQPHVSGDTCCPGSDVQSGRAPCVPGNCPLYSSETELPANPFFARIVGGRCECAPPQICAEPAGARVDADAMVVV